MTCRCLLVDDEALALNVLEEYVNKLNQLELVAKCDNSVQAFEILQKGKIDLLFIDIQMPQLDGLGLIRNLSNPPKVILTTDFRDYAMEGFELNVVDYLLKPISFERFLKAVSRVISPKESSGTKSDVKKVKTEEPYLCVKSDKRMLKVFVKDILLIESLGSYIQIFTKKEKIICYKRISEFEEKLASQGFFRVHRSFIVSMEHIDSYSASIIEIGSHKVPIGRNYKNEFIDEMRKMNSISI